MCLLSLCNKRTTIVWACDTEFIPQPCPKRANTVAWPFLRRPVGNRSYLPVPKGKQREEFLQSVGQDCGTDALMMEIYDRNLLKGTFIIQPVAVE